MASGGAYLVVVVARVNFGTELLIRRAKVGILYYLVLRRTPLLFLDCIFNDQTTSDTEATDQDGVLSARCSSLPRM